MLKACEYLGIPYNHDDFAEGVLNAEKYYKIFLIDAPFKNSNLIYNGEYYGSV